MRHRVLATGDSRLGTWPAPGERPFLGGVLAASVAVLAGTVIVAGVLVRAAGEDRSSPGAAPPAQSSSAAPVAPPTVRLEPATAPPPASASPSPSRSPSPSPSPRIQRPPTLTGRYATEAGSVSLVSYRGQVAIGNPGTVPVDGWTVTITLPRATLAMSEVEGAVARQDGAVWTFTPVPGTRRVPAGGTVAIRFKVGGTTPGTAPRSCEINTVPCT